MADSRPVDLEIEGLQDPAEIGIGGFATVYKAYQPAFRRTVAVKVLATLNLDEAARERFERECQAMGSLSEHPNIVTVYGAGFNANGRPYLVMAFLSGGSLQDRIDRDGTISWQDATTYGVHLAGALETAHRAEIVHRDIKPGNVLMSTYGDAQLTDFGIARISGGHETRSGVITASMAHAPPEVLDGNRPTISADVYSLGSTIYELMCGHPAFHSEQDESMVPMLRRILTEPPPDLRPLGVPDQVCQVIERSMLKDPAQRQTSALQFGRELQAARRSLGVEPGKLTVPSDVSLDVSEGEEINFVAAPFTGQFTGPIDDVGSVGTVGQPGQTGPFAPPAYDPVTASPTGPVYSQHSGQVPADASMPGYSQTGPVAMPAEKKGAKGLLVGVIALLVLAVAVIGAVVVVGSQKGITASSSNTSAVIAQTTKVSITATTDSSTPTTPNTSEDIVVRGYTAEDEVQFVDPCAKKNSRLFCRCVFKEIKETIPYQRYLELNAEVADSKTLDGTEIQPLIEDCTKRNPPTPPTTK